MDHARELFAQAKANGKVIAGMIIEPVLSEGGDLHASHDYFRKLRQIALEHDCAFIVDEVLSLVRARDGGVSGRGGA